MTLYALHYGTRRNRFYGLYTERPTVVERTVTDERTGRSTTLYESPDQLQLNVCVSGFERLFGIAVPLGGVCRITFEVDDEC